MLNSIARILATGLLLVPASAMAVPITVDFTVTGTSAFYSDGSSLSGDNGFPLGTIGSGSFTIDNSMGNYSNVNVGITPIDFSLDWAGTSLTEANSVLWEVGFDEFGGFNYWGFSGTEGSCGILNCVSSIGVTDFFVSGYGGPYVSNGETGVAVTQRRIRMDAGRGDLERSSSRGRSAGAATLGLLAFGLLGAGVARRKRAAWRPTMSMKTAPSGAAFVWLVLEPVTELHQQLFVVAQREAVAQRLVRSAFGHILLVAAATVHDVQV